MNERRERGEGIWQQKIQEKRSRNKPRERGERCKELNTWEGIPNCGTISIYHYTRDTSSSTVLKDLKLGEKRRGRGGGEPIIGEDTEDDSKIFVYWQL